MDMIYFFFKVTYIIFQIMATENNQFKMIEKHVKCMSLSSALTKYGVKSKVISVW